jgi:hypothetical protein
MPGPTAARSKQVLGVVAGDRVSAATIALRLRSNGELGCLDWLYPTLYRLDAQGYLRGGWQVEDSGRRWTYRATARGGPSPKEASGGSLLGIAFTPKDVATPEPLSPAAYLHRLMAQLKLKPSQAERAFDEIEAHFVDAGILDTRGNDTGDPGAAETLLGPADRLAESITAELSGVMSPLRAAVGVLPWLPFVLVTAIVASTLLVSIVRLLPMALLRWMSRPGSLPAGAGWEDGVLELSLVVALFVTGRLMAGMMLNRMNRDSSVIVLSFALIAAGLVAGLAASTPIMLDPLTIGLLMAMPLALIAGASRPTLFRGSLLSIRQVAAVLVVAAIVGFNPFDGFSAHWPAQPIAGNVGSLSVERGGESGWQCTISSGTVNAYTDLSLMVWPITRSGWFLQADTGDLLDSWHIKFDEQRFYDAQDFYGKLVLEGSCPVGGDRDWLLQLWGWDNNGNHQLLAEWSHLPQPGQQSLLTWLGSLP